MSGEYKIISDGFRASIVGNWSEEKYRYFNLYLSIFAKSMKKQWTLVYIDLFAGCGKSIVKDTPNIVLGSPLIALSSSIKFDKYIFCEKDPDNFFALQSRVNIGFPNSPVTLINDDTNLAVDKIANCIPPFSKSRKVLIFCFVDPFKCANLKFSTIAYLSKYLIDFLVLIPSGMDASRNSFLYEKENQDILDTFLGNNLWRNSLQTVRANGQPFEHFVIDEFNRSMINLGFKEPPIDSAAPIRNNNKALLYRLALYSRHELGQKHWQQVKKYGKQQMDLI